MGTKANPTIRSGKRRVPSQNPFVRTRARYSRRTTMRRLCMGLALSHLLDEDAVERRCHDLEPPDSNSPDGCPEEGLGIGVLMQPDLQILAVIVDASDARKAGQERTVPLHLHQNRVLAQARLDGREKPVQDHPSPIDEPDLPTEFLGGVHQIGSASW